MGDPVGTKTHVRHALADDGTWLLVEPIAGHTPEDAYNSVGRVFLAGSTILCTPSALAHHGPHAVGNQVGEGRCVNSSARRA